MLIRQSAIYVLGNLIQAALAIGAVALYTRLLTTTEFGAYSFVVAVVQFGYAFSSSWIATAIVRLYWKADAHERFLGAVLLFYLVIVALSALGTAVLVAALETAAQRRLAILGCLYFAAMTWMELSLRVFQARLEAARQARSRVARAIIALGLGGALAALGAGPEGIVLGLAIGSCLPGLASLRRDWRGVTLGGDAAMRRTIIQFGAPLAVSFAIGAFNAFAGRFMVSGLMGIAALGVYALAFEIANRAAQGLMDPIASAAAPISVRELETSGVDAARAMLRRSAILLLALIVPAGAGLALVSPDLTATLVGPDFRDAAGAVLPWLAVAAFATSFQQHYLDHAFHLGLRSKRLIWRASIMLTLNVILNFALISRFGVIGAGYAAVIGVAISMVLTGLLGRTAFRLPFPLGPFALIVLATSGMAAAVLAVPGEPGLARLLAKIAAGAVVYAAVAWALDVGGVRSRTPEALTRLALLRKSPTTLGRRVND